ncbi:c-type cytochrome [Maritimibacter dapengensis]|uniref:Cytochrome c n=1 Tax=Maritimibacter dapengensis TaxID=2836868 RepID=A0ABS6T2Q8_9RHOB|nr:cytochrome c [Maritimibacter dapengensis]MBV7378841.1 cytochrome c [Maritimibacter dapengensis]
MKYLAILPAIIVIAACTLDPDPAEGPTGAELYATYCAGCHGADATGGDMVGTTRAANLTTLAARHDGTFPAAYVMSTIDGYAREETHGPMPVFGELLGGEMGMWEDANGTPTPTPLALIRLAEYLEGLQA